MAVDGRPQLGRLGERLACEHLERLGLRILERNHRTRYGELDVIAHDPRASMIVFVEVKTRRAGCGPPLEALGPDKRRRVRRLARHWLAEVERRPRACGLRFDAIGVAVDRDGRLAALEHLEGAF